MIDGRIALADLLRHVGEVEFDRPTTTRLQVDKPQPVLRAEHVARMRLAVQQLLLSTALLDRSKLVSWRARPGAIIILHDGEHRGERTVRALGRILPSLQERGLRAVTLGELMRASDADSPLPF